MSNSEKRQAGLIAITLPNIGETVIHVEIWAHKAIWMDGVGQKLQGKTEIHKDILHFLSHI